jgi:AbrB family looped-hinge helix DNA binding protein
MDGELQFVEIVIQSNGHAMQSTITARGQTVVPAAIRNQFHLGPSDRLEWVLDNGSIRVVPVRANPIEAFRGQGKGSATSRLLAARKQDRARE